MWYDIGQLIFHRWEFMNSPENKMIWTNLRIICDTRLFTNCDLKNVWGYGVDVILS